MVSQQKVLPPFAAAHAYLPAVEFSPIPTTPTNARRIKQHARHSACERVLTHSMEAFGKVSKYQMAKLLGFTHVNNIFKYFNGRSRPSQLYSTRLVQLWLMFNSGIPLFKIRSIDWDRSIIVWKDGHRSSGQDILGIVQPTTAATGRRTTNELPEAWDNTPQKGF
jgi:hypothetical protein